MSAASSGGKNGDGGGQVAARGAIAGDERADGRKNASEIQAVLPLTWMAEVLTVNLVRA